MKKRIPDDYLDDMDSDWNRTLDEIEDAYFSLADTMREEHPHFYQEVIDENPTLFSTK